MIIFASDLDQTLIFSQSFIEKNHNEKCFENLHTIELIDEKASSFCSRNTLELLREISQKTLFIPATTRTIEQFYRVLLHKNAISYKYAIASNGGNIICNGIVDFEWNSNIKKRLHRDCLSFDEVYSWVNKINQKYNFVVTSKEAEDLFLYFIIDPDRFHNDILEETREYFYKYNWNVSVQLKKLYFTPNFLNKALALEEIKNREERIDKTYSSGDAYLDIELLRASDFGFVPLHSELAKKYVARMGDNIYITKENGLYAAEEILNNVLTFL